MEDGITNKIQIMFTIDVADEIGDSDFNTLVLRVQKLRYTRKNTITEVEAKLHNRNIEEMKKLLDNFKIETFEEV